jgi:hypothetical protein
MGTIFGIPEDEGSEDVPVQLSIFQPSSSSTGGIRCSCQGPHSDWKRRQRPLPLPLPPLPLLALESLPQRQQQQQQQKLHLWWMDLQTVSSPLVTSQAGVMHLLQSVLSPSHAASPWVNNEDDEDSSILPDIVVLIVYHHDNDKMLLEVLKDFRVSDAAPSWFLHSIALCDQLESDAEQLFGGIKSTTIGNNPGGGTLYIYKRLAPRPQFLSTLPPNAMMMTTTTSSSSPTTTTTTKKEEQPTVLGCLWERIDSPSPSLPV